MNATSDIVRFGKEHIFLVEIEIKFLFLKFSLPSVLFKLSVHLVK